MKQKPFVKLLKTPYSHAFYDVNRNALVSTTEAVYRKLEEILEAPQADVELLLQDPQIQKLREKGYLLETRPDVIRHPYTDLAEPLMQDKIARITIQVTQSCNFRCAYCAYTNPDQGRQREHSAKSMDLETAKKSLHFLHEHSANTGEITVGLYGGEPFLKFDLIKEIVKYAEELFAGKPLSFNVTTNGSIFTDEIVEFCMAHPIRVAVSLDGNRETHDRNRKLASTGEGTFDLVMSRLNWVKQNHPEFSENCSLNMVLDTSADYDCYNQVFTDYEAVRKDNATVNFIDTDLTNLGYTVDERFWVKFQYDIFLGLMNELGFVSNENRSPISLYSKLQLYKAMDNLTPGVPFGEATALGSATAPGGPCVPGLARLFVDSYGNLFPCEKCSETSSVMCIGSLDDGFDFDKVRSLLNVGNIAQEQCRNCWAFRHCTVCAATIEDGESLSVQKKLKKCRAVRENFEISLTEILSLQDARSIMRRGVKV